MGAGAGAGAGTGEWASTTMANSRANMSTTPITPPLDDEPKHTAILIETQTQTQRDMKMRTRTRMICERVGSGSSPLKKTQKPRNLDKLSSEE